MRIVELQNANTTISITVRIVNEGKFKCAYRLISSLEDGPEAVTAARDAVVQDPVLRAPLEVPAADIRAVKG